MAGNANSGRKQEKPFADALRMAIADAGPDHKALRGIAAKLLKLAEDGEGWAIRELADRLDGKPAQAIDADVRHSADDTIMGLLERIASNGKPIHG